MIHFNKKSYLTPADLSDRWVGAITTGTLSNWRSLGKGPPYVKIGGKVLYPLLQVVSWEKENKVYLETGHAEKPL